ncbi:MAG: hypothetical protein ACI8QG_001201, partial [Flavobacteriales bacterium]
HMSSTLYLSVEFNWQPYKNHNFGCGLLPSESGHFKQ